MLRRAIVMAVFLVAGSRRVQGQNDVPGQLEAYYRQRGPALADSVRRLLAGPTLRFADYVAIENVILAEPAVLSRSGELQYRRLRLIGAAEAVRDLDDSSTTTRNWRLSHDEFLEQSPFERESFPRAEPFWKLIDRFPKAAWAEEAAWHAARLPRPSDECYPGCVLELFVNEAYLPYWVRYPAGPHVAAAIDSASRRVKYAVQMACSVKGHDEELGFPTIMAAKIRRSLTSVTAPNKAALIRLLDAGVAKCQKPVPKPPSK